MTVVPIELNANKPRTPVRVNGAGPFDFLVDTGSIFDLVDTERAEELGLASAGEFDAGGAGEATMTTSTATGVRLGLGDLDLPRQDVEVAPINAAIGRLEGRRLDGLLGYDFFSRFPVELDYVAETLTIGCEPRGTEVPLRLVRRHPFVRAAFELGGRRFEHEFVVDTGFRSGLVLASPFVREEGLVELAGPTIEATTGAGIGGPTVERVGRAARFELGPFVLENVLVTCPRRALERSPTRGSVGSSGARSSAASPRRSTTRARGRCSSRTPTSASRSSSTSAASTSWAATASRSSASSRARPPRRRESGQATGSSPSCPSTSCASPSEPSPASSTHSRSSATVAASPRLSASSG